MGIVQPKGGFVVAFSNTNVVWNNRIIGQDKLKEIAKILGVPDNMVQSLTEDQDQEIRSIHVFGDMPGPEPEDS